MGQGYSLTTLSAGSATIDVPELADLQYEKSLGNARFMKCIRARHKDGLVIAKVVMKPSANKNWDDYITLLSDERKELVNVPNALANYRILQTSTSGYLVRQYMHSSLYDRMSNRPFLDSIEKKWLAFQLLTAVRDCHARNIFHGDIKTENVLVTSWNWLYLADFSSSYKPTYLPEDNPADFSFYFDTSGRRTCYLAPERFLQPGENSKGMASINWAMDIFSVGCVIAELFLETPIFSLSQLFKYRSKTFDPIHTLDGIKDKDIREMVLHMIQVEPEKRYSADEYLSFWKNRAFPEYFYSFLHQYMYLITDATSGQKPVTTGSANLGEADERIVRVFNDFEKISYYLGYETPENLAQSQSRPPFTPGSLFPLQIDIPNYRHEASNTLQKPKDDGTLLFLTLVEVSLRNTARAQARLKGCELLLAFGERVSDETKIDRILPYLIDLLSEDKSPMVKVAALRSVTQLLELVDAIAGINAYIFPEYLLPRLARHCLHANAKNVRPNTWLRATYASCLSNLARTASRFLDMMQALRADGALPTTDPETEAGTLSHSVFQNLHDSTRHDLLTQFEIHSTELLTDDDPNVRRAFLGSIPSLCVFFGTPKAADVILSHLNTYLNDRDWRLKCAFFEAIVGIAAFVGGAVLEEYILPLMIQTLVDPEEAVVEKVIRSFSAIAQLGLFQRSTTWELVDVVSRFTMHPNSWIREAAADFVAAAAKYLAFGDAHAILMPLIIPYLKTRLSDITELDLLTTLKPPLPRLILEMATAWAIKAEKGAFWQAVKRQRTFSFASGRSVIPSLAGQDIGLKAFGRLPRDKDDEQWIRRLQTAGFGVQEEFKLVALREYIFLVSKHTLPATTPYSNGIIKLSALKITPQVVIFDQDEDIFQHNVQDRGSSENKQPRTIDEALQEASKTAFEPHFDGMSRTTRDRRESAADGSAQSALPEQIAPDVRSQPQSHVGLDVARTLQLPTSIPGPEIASSIDSKASLRLGDPDHALRSRGSALNLIGRTDAGSKAVAEISTTPTNVFGKVEGRGMQSRRVSTLAQAKEEHQRNPASTLHKVAHNYVGHDPSVLKHLDSLYLDNYPIDNIEFGPLIAPRRTKGDAAQRAGGQVPNTPWRPEGNLVALIGEHAAPVNRVAVSPDHNFFITGSDDGTVKVWDAARLEYNTSHRSRQTHRHASGTRVTSLTFIENTHCFVSTGSDGSVHVVRVDYLNKGDEKGSARYSKLKTVREFSLPEGDYAVWCEHFKEENRSLLILATNGGRIIALELRTMSILYELENPARHGIIQTFCLDKQRHWLLLGTTHGVLDLWDLRFQLLVKSWRFPGSSPIYRILLIPTRRSTQLRVAIAGGTGQGEVTVWDLEKVACYQVYRTGLCKDNVKGSSSPYRLIDMDDEKSGGVLSRFATAPEPSSHAGGDRGVRALVMGDRFQDNENGTFNPRDKKYFIVSAGPDWKVRFWESSRHEASMIVSGMELEEGKPTYHTTLPVPDLMIVSEILSPPSPISSSSAGTSSPARGNNSRGKDGKIREKSRSSGIVSMQQQHLLKSHLDTIMDVALLEVPYGMIVSVDRMGCIYIFS